MNQLQTTQERIELLRELHQTLDSLTRWNEASRPSWDDPMLDAAEVTRNDAYNKAERSVLLAIEAICGNPLTA